MLSAGCPITTPKTDVVPCLNKGQDGDELYHSLLMGFPCGVMPTATFFNGRTDNLEAFLKHYPDKATWPFHALCLAFLLTLCSWPILWVIAAFARALSALASAAVDAVAGGFPLAV